MLIFYELVEKEIIDVGLNTESPQINMSGLQAGSYMMKVSIDGASQSFSEIKK